MIKYDSNINDAVFVLDNLRDEDIQELTALWGREWKQKTIDNLKSFDFLVMVGKDENKNNIPIAIGGFAELFEKNTSIACVWLLTSYFIKYNKKLFLSEIKNCIRQAENKYYVMYNYIYKSNFQAKKWLKDLGFSFGKSVPSNPNYSDNFQFFYKINC